MLLKKRNLQKIINNNISQQSPSKKQENELFDPEKTVPISQWIFHLQKKNPSLNSPPKNLTLIFSLNLSQSSLEVFPEEIMQLISLKFLVLDDNFIRAVPKNLFTLKNLEMFSIANNRIENIGSNLKKLVKLTYLNVSKNNIGELSEEIRHLSNLETLMVQNNSFENLPTFLHELHNLKELGLDWCLFLSPSLEKAVITKEKDPLFNNLMFFLKTKTKEISIEEFLNAFSQRKYEENDQMSKLLNKNTIYKCALHNYLGVLNVILRKAPHLMNETNEKGLSLFSVSVINKYPFIPELILNINTKMSSNEFGAHNSPLNLAITNLNSDLAIKLIKLGGFNHIADNEGNTPLHILFDGRFSKFPLEKSQEIASLLLDSGLLANTENKLKMTAINLAIKQNEYDAVEWALNYNQKKRVKKHRFQNLFDFDQKFGAFSFTSAHYAIFLDHGSIVELMSHYPEEVDFFEKCKTGKIPRKVAYKNMVLIKLCYKCEKKWIRNKIISGLDPVNNINQLPEGIKVTHMLGNHPTERPKSKSEFKSAPSKNAHIALKKENSNDFDDLAESPCIKKGLLNISLVKSTEKSPNNIGNLGLKTNNFIGNDNINNYLEENIKIQNEILLKMQYKTVTNETIEQLFKNLFVILSNPELTFSDKTISLLFIRLFQYKINSWTQKFTSKTLTYNVFLINTFFNNPTKVFLINNLRKMLARLLINFAENLQKNMENTTKNSVNNENNSQIQLLFGEFLKICLDQPLQKYIQNFSFSQFFSKNNHLFCNYEVFQAQKTFIYKQNFKKIEKKTIEMNIEKKTIDITIEKNTVEKENPQKIINKAHKNKELQTFLFNGNKVCVASSEKSSFITEEDFNIIDSTRKSSLKAYYFPSKQDFSPFQTKEKGGLK